MTAISPPPKIGSDDDLPEGIDDEELSEISVNISDPFDPTLIRVERSTPTIDLLTRRIRDGAINLAPDFQRKGGIWTDGAQSRLIESILIRIPLPAFYVDATDENHWLVVDGLQRMTALKRFIHDQTFCLHGLEFLHDLDGRKFDDLPRNLQRRIEETEVIIFLIQPGTPPEVKFNIFKRINTGGLPLSAQEIRNAINGDRVRQFVLGLAESDEFKTATHNSIGDKRMADRECVTRFLAFRMHPPTDYAEKDFDSFLNTAMAKLDDGDKVSDAELMQLGRNFTLAMTRAETIFGKHAFRKYFGPDRRLSLISKALFEATACGLVDLTKHQVALLASRSEELLDSYAKLNYDADFNASISQGTNAPSRVRHRFQAMADFFQSFF